MSCGENNKPTDLATESIGTVKTYPRSGKNDGTVSRKSVLGFLMETVNCDLDMDTKEHTDEDTIEKISALNDIFDNVISDTSDLIKDLYWGVKTYLFYGNLLKCLDLEQKLLYIA